MDKQKFTVGQNSSSTRDPSTLRPIGGESNENYTPEPIPQTRTAEDAMTGNNPTKKKAAKKKTAKKVAKKAVAKQPETMDGQRPDNEPSSPVSTVAAELAALDEKLAGSDVRLLSIGTQPVRMLAEARGKHHGLFLFIREYTGDPRRRPSPTEEPQAVRDLRAEGYEAQVCFGADQAHDALYRYLSFDRAELSGA